MSKKELLVVPHSLDAERALLGAILLDASAWPMIAEVIGPLHFYRTAHQQIFVAISVLLTAGTAVDFVTVKNELQRVAQLEAVGGPAYLSSLADGMARGANVAHYAAIVREKAKLREVIQVAGQTTAAAYAETDSADQVIDRAVRDFLGQTEGDNGHRVVLGDELAAYALSLDEDTSTDTVTSGYTDIDTILDGGLTYGELSVLAGRPGSGKSSLGMGIALGAARAGIPAAIISIEMKARALASRVLSWVSGVEYTRLVRRRLDEADRDAVIRGVQATSGLPVYVVDPDAVTLSSLTASVMRLKAEFGVRLVVVDYLQLLTPDGRLSSREVEVATLSRGLARIARTQGVALLALSQLNRAPEGRRDKRPRLSDLRESGQIEADCSVGLLLHRAEQYSASPENRGRAEVIIAKNRHGAAGVAILAFLAGQGARFANLDMIHSDDII